MTAALTRRSFIASVSAAALLPNALSAQTGPAIDALLARLSGFDPLPQDLVEGLRRAVRINPSDDLSDAFEKRLLRALYTGVLPASEDEQTGTRIGFSNALMWAAIEDSNNVISYCGGVPGFWADPPDVG